MLLATFIVAGILSVIRAPVIPVWSPVVELLVRIVQEPPAAEPETQQTQPPLATPSPDVSERAAEPPPTKRNPKNLPWVADIVQRYEYLRDPDGYVKGEE